MSKKKRKKELLAVWQYSKSGKNGSYVARKKANRVLVIRLV